MLWAEQNTVRDGHDTLLRPALGLAECMMYMTLCSGLFLAGRWCMGVNSASGLGVEYAAVILLSPLATPAPGVHLRERGRGGGGTG